ncbi:hypothetical protein [Streptomyces naphthomycinicus]|uniref:hypothetical protein n=1 Tax=Streptomyces naphthomycinicus TaxID=2872625 RepID=UPI0028899BEC|nr:hypothetical protein [Streptomyces sp. TML10]
MEPPPEATAPLTRRSLMDAAAACFGWRRAHGDTAKVDALLTEQSETAYTTAADHATAKNHDALAVQPGVLDARGRILADVLYREGVLTGVRTAACPARSSIAWRTSSTTATN